jgi:hypothetical protein
MWARQRLVLWLAAAGTLVVSVSGYPQSTIDKDTLYQDQGSKLEKSNKMWAESDNCGKESFQKFPDYTAEGARNRDAFMRDCLRKHHLPPRSDLAQPLRPPQ